MVYIRMPQNCTTIAWTLEQKQCRSREIVNDGKSLCNPTKLSNIALSYPAAGCIRVCCNKDWSTDWEAIFECFGIFLQTAIILCHGSPIQLSCALCQLRQFFVSCPCFRKRGVFFKLVENEEYQWNNAEHRELLRYNPNLSWLVSS